MVSRGLVAALALVAGVAAAEDARQIVEESQRRTRANSERYEGNLEVIGSNSKVSRKSWTYARLGSFGNSKSVIRFTSPPEVKGVALLIFNHPDRSSDQWMWTPAVGRDRRVALQDRSARFFGTDFSFEDLEERDIDQYDYQLTGEEQIGGASCWRIDARPRKGKVSQYTLSRLWIRKDNYVAVQQENFIEGKLVRRLVRGDLQEIEGIWTARLLEMTDLRRNSRTILRIAGLQYNVSMSEDDFTLQALRRGE